MPARIVTSTYRYKRPPRKRKAIVTVIDRKLAKRRAAAEQAQRLAA